MKQYLTFRVAEETYGIDVLSIKEVLETVQITRVPKAPPLLVGVFNLRGSVVPAVDLAFKLGAERGAGEPATVVTELVVGGEPLSAGLLVEEVYQVVGVDEADILPPPSVGSGSGADFVDGVVRTGEGGGFIILLDPRSIVKSGEIEEAALQ